MAEQTLKEKTSKGLFWGGLSNGVQQLLSAFFGIYLARILSPDDYGLVGMLTIFSLVALTLQEGGLFSALLNRKEIRHNDYNAVFWFSLLVSFTCYLLLFFCAPLIARYFHQPALVKLARWSFLSIILAGLNTAHRAYLTKKLMVKEIAIVGMLSIAISGILGIYLAWKGMGYWTLVIQSLFWGALTSVGYWFFSRWHPSFHIDFQPVKEMFGYSAKLLISSFLSIINSNVLSIVIGRHYSAERVGFYTQANKWSSMGSNTLLGMVNSVAHPVFAAVVDEKDRQLRVFRKMIRFTAFVSFPAMFGLAFIAPEFILVTLTDKWRDSIELLQIIAVAGAFIPLATTFNNLLLSHGKSSVHLWVNLACSLTILAVVYFLSPKGVTAMVIGISVINTIWLFVWFVFVRQAIGYTMRGLFADLIPFLGISLVSIGLSYLVVRGIGNPALRMGAKIIMVAALYILIMWLSGSVTIRECVDLLLKKINKNR